MLKRIFSETFEVDMDSFVANELFLVAIVGDFNLESKITK